MITMTSQFNRGDRRPFIGGSDARIIMGNDESALLRLWREKRGEAEPEDLSGNLVVQLGIATEELNRRWFQANSGQVLTDIQKHVQHPGLHWMAATLDGRVESSGAIFEVNLCFLGHFQRRRRRRSMPLSCNTICSSSPQGRRYFQSSPAAASGLKSRPMPIRFTSISLSPPSGNSGAVLKLASPPPCLARIRRSRGSRPYALSI